MANSKTMNFSTMKNEAERVTTRLKESIDEMGAEASELREAWENLEYAMGEFNEKAESTENYRDKLIEAASEYKAFAEDFAEGGSMEVMEFIEDSIPTDDFSGTTCVDDCENFNESINDGWIEAADDLDFDIAIVEPEIDPGVLADTLKRVVLGLDAKVDLDILSKEFPGSEFMSKAVEVLWAGAPFSEESTIGLANKLNALITEISSTDTLDEDKVGEPKKEDETWTSINGRVYPLNIAKKS